MAKKSKLHGGGYWHESTQTGGHVMPDSWFHNTNDESHVTTDEQFRARLKELNKDTPASAWSNLAKMSRRMQRGGK